MLADRDFLPREVVNDALFQQMSTDIESLGKSAIQVTGDYLRLMVKRALEQFCKDRDLNYKDLCLRQSQMVLGIPPTIWPSIQGPLGATVRQANDFDLVNLGPLRFIAEQEAVALTVLSPRPPRIAIEVCILVRP